MPRRLAPGTALAGGLPRRVVALVLAASCTAPSGISVGPGGSGGSEPSADASAAGATAAPAVGITSAAYGSLTVRTAPGARCDAHLDITAGHFGEQPPSSLDATVAGADGTVSWTYPAPRVPKGSARASVTCRTSVSSVTESASFEIAPAPLVATGFTVRVTTSPPPSAAIDHDPSLLPLRDTAAQRMRDVLPTEWRAATRGLGALRIVEQSADITIFVVAAEGTSVNRSYPPDGSSDIVVYVSGRIGQKTVENVVATALHELGHIWCCFGPGTTGGHWVTNEPSPGLYGVDKYGLMTDPVTCVTFGAVVSCPNRFSDREMVALGFSSFPPPALDPCVGQALSLKQSLAELDQQLSALKGRIDAGKARLASIESEIRSIEQQYPHGGAPPSVVTRYDALVSEHTALRAQTNAQVAEYNALLERARAVERQLRGLPCDAS